MRNIINKQKKHHKHKHKHNVRYNVNKYNGIHITYKLVDYLVVYLNKEANPVEDSSCTKLLKQAASK